jgi:Type II secretion system (T2SS), protein F
MTTPPNPASGPPAVAAASGLTSGPLPQPSASPGIWAASAADAPTSTPLGLLVALALLAGALLAAGGRPGRGRLRDLGEHAPTLAAEPAPVLRRPWIVVAALAVGTLGWAVAGVPAAVVAGGATGLVTELAARSAAARATRTEAGGEDLAGSWELLAACLQAGLPVAAAVSAAAEPLAGSVGAQLRRVAGLLALGADPAAAWASTEQVPALVAFARAAARSAGTGAALAHVATAEAERLRADLLDHAQSRAQRAAVLIAGPLGLCFLPAFLVLGIAPVVIGLAREALAQW